MSFREECEEWLKPLGYSIHMSNPNGNYYQFLNMEDTSYPAIICRQEDGKKTAELLDAQYSYFLHMSSGPIQFKHPDIKKYMAVMAYYNQLVQKFPAPLDLINKKYGR